jgi:hypothetical protein
MRCLYVEPGDVLCAAARPRTVRAVTRLVNRQIPAF